MFKYVTYVCIYNFCHFNRKLNVVNDDECEWKTTRMRKANKEKKIEIQKDIVTNMLAVVVKVCYALHKGVEKFTLKTIIIPLFFLFRPLFRQKQ